MSVIENLEQGSKEWHEFRAKHVMGTDIPVILGSNKWKTKLELWEEKKGIRPAQEINEAMKRGMTLEKEARELAINLIGTNFHPKVIESDEYPWLGVSLDGLDDMYKKYILEIKCPKEITHVDAVGGIIPVYYVDQIQAQLLVSKADICYYFSYRPEYKEKPYAIINVYPDKEKQKEIVKKGYEFYLQLCNMEEPKEWLLKQR